MNIETIAGSIMEEIITLIKNESGIPARQSESAEVVYFGILSFRLSAVRPISPLGRYTWIPKIVRELAVKRNTASV